MTYLSALLCHSVINTVGSESKVKFPLRQPVVSSPQRFCSTWHWLPHMLTDTQSHKPTPPIVCHSHTFQFSLLHADKPTQTQWKGPEAVWPKPSMINGPSQTYGRSTWWPDKLWEVKTRSLHTNKTLAISILYWAWLQINYIISTGP